ncbi:MAG: T9SS type A sorting domain-containing protein, partial [bacterium]
GAEDTVPCTWGDLVSSDLYVPVELSSFEVKVNASGQVELFWRTQTESNNYGFEVQRKAQNTAFEKIGFVPGAGTTSEPQYYDYVDHNLAPGVYFYRLKQIDFDGAFEYSQMIRAELPAPHDFILYQNYPNPFNASTKLKFELPEDSHVIIQIFNTKGQQVITLIDQDYMVGIHEVVWDGLTDSQTSAPSGLYLCRFQTKNIRKTQKMILLR